MDLEIFGEFFRVNVTTGANMEIFVISGKINKKESKESHRRGNLCTYFAIVPIIFLISLAKFGSKWQNVEEISLP